MIRIVVLLAIVCVIGILGSANPVRADDGDCYIPEGCPGHDTEFYGTVTGRAPLIVFYTCMTDSNNLVHCNGASGWRIRVDGTISGQPGNSTVDVVTEATEACTGSFPSCADCVDGFEGPGIQNGDKVHVHVRGLWLHSGWTQIDACHTGDSISKCNPSEPNQLNTCTLKTGDLLVIHKDDALYVALHTLFNGAYWTHVGIYNGDGTITESYPNGAFDVHPGVKVTNFDDSNRSDWRTAPDWEVLRVKTLDSTRDAAVDAAVAKSKQYTEYNWNFAAPINDSSSENHFYCSEFVWWAYRQVGININPSPIANTPLPPDFLEQDNEVATISQRPGFLRGVLRLIQKYVPAGVASTTSADAADLYVTDGQGRHAGKDPVTGQIVNEIPGVMYPGPDTEPETMAIEHMDATWDVQVIGKDSGSYTLEAEPIQPGDPQTTSLTKDTSPGQVDDYTLKYPNSPGQTISVQPAGSPGLYHPVTPARIVDTRTSTGGHPFKLGEGEVATFPVTGVGGVPSSGVTAVAINLSATEGTFFSYLTVYPSDAVRPNASNLNFVLGEDVPNMVIVKVGADGRVDVYNYGGQVHVIMDVVGWFGSGTGGSAYNPVPPARIVDTRTSTGGHPYKVGEGEVATFHVTAVGGIPASGVSAVVVNVSVTQGDFPSYLTVFPSGMSLPNASNLNFTPSEDVANLAIVKVGADGNIDVYNYGGHVDVILDVVGWFGATGGSYSPLTPARVVDTRTSIGGHPYKLGEGESAVFHLTGVGGVPNFGVTSVVINVSATAGNFPSYLTVYPSDVSRPNASNLNFLSNQDVPNLVIVKVGSGGNVSIYNYGGQVDVVVDVAGYFSDSPTSPTPTPTSQPTHTPTPTPTPTPSQRPTPTPRATPTPTSNPNLFVTIQPDPDDVTGQFHYVVLHLIACSTSSQSVGEQVDFLIESAVGSIVNNKNGDPAAGPPLTNLTGKAVKASALDTAIAIGVQNGGIVVEPVSAMGECQAWIHVSDPLLQGIWGVVTAHDQRGDVSIPFGQGINP